MEELEARGLCIFCPEGRAWVGAPEPEFVGGFWFATVNDFPYSGTASHHLLVSRSHVTSFDQLPDAAGAELWALRRELKLRYGTCAEATIERSGDIRFNGGSIAHLHVHFVTLDDIPPSPVRFRVSGKPKVEAHQHVMEQ
jgi:ATP adenylyltransferase